MYIFPVKKDCKNIFKYMITIATDTQRHGKLLQDVKVRIVKCPSGHVDTFLEGTVKFLLLSRPNKCWGIQQH